MRRSKDAINLLLGSFLRKSIKSWHIHKLLHKDVASVVNTGTAQFASSSNNNCKVLKYSEVLDKRVFSCQRSRLKKKLIFSGKILVVHSSEGKILNMEKIIEGFLPCWSTHPSLAISIWRLPGNVYYLIHN